MSAIVFAIKGIIVSVAGFAAVSAWADDTTIDGKRIFLPPGFHMAVYAQVPGARTLTAARELGAIFVGTQDQDIYAILDPDLDGNPGQPIKVKSSLNAPHGVAWHGSHLYVAERDRVIRFRGESIEDIIAAPPEVLFDRLPDNPHHGWRYAAVGPDNNIYVAVGAPCNICRATGYEGTIVRLPIAGGEAQIFARGIRNAVGLDFQPKTGVLYFTDNGADNMGEDSPPDELNRAARAGMHFGFPWYGGGTDRTADFRRHIIPGKTEPPVAAFGAHVAALGVDFYDGDQFPAEYRGDAFVAQHGSSNRAIPDGYRIARVRFDADGSAREFGTFISGWLQDNGKVWGRPVDLEELADGSLLISDDYVGAIYRVTYAN